MLIMLETDLKGMRALVDKYESRMMPHLVGLVRARYTDEQLTGAVMARKAVVNTGNKCTGRPRWHGSST